MDKFAQLEKINELKTKGVLTEKEFEDEKFRLLNDDKNKTGNSDEYDNEQLYTPQKNAQKIFSWQMYFSSRGRITRIKYLSGVLAPWGLLIVGIIVFALVGTIIMKTTGIRIDAGGIGYMVGQLIVFPILISYIILGIKRLHDLNYSGWWIWIPGVWILIFFIPGTSGNNKYGPQSR